MMACTPHYQLGLSKVLQMLLTQSSLGLLWLSRTVAIQSSYVNKSLNIKSQSKEGDKKKLRIAIALIVVLIIYLVLSTIAIVAAFIQISQLSRDIEDASNMLNSVVDRIATVENATAQLQSESQQTRNDIEMLTGSSPCFPAFSCAALPCPSISYSASSFQYSRVCGSIRAYRYETTDAFGKHAAVRPDLSKITVDDNYVDGVSLTHGNETRQHIWTFAAGVYNHDGIPTCPCGGARSFSDARPPNFVGNNYFCDASSSNGRDYDTSNPLWDGKGCELTGSCCTFNNPPWFYKQLPHSTTDDIEIRVCSDEERSNEDVRIEKIHIFVQ